jgi:hypothetical protein
MQSPADVGVPANMISKAKMVSKFIIVSGWTQGCWRGRQQGPDRQNKREVYKQCRHIGVSDRVLKSSLVSNRKTPMGQPSK